MEPRREDPRIVCSSDPGTAFQGGGGERGGVKQLRTLEHGVVFLVHENCEHQHWVVPAWVLGIPLYNRSARTRVGQW